MLQFIIIGGLLILSQSFPSTVTAQTSLPYGGGTVYLSFIGTNGEHVLTHANISYERKAELPDPILDWGRIQFVVLKPAGGGGFFRGGGGPIKADGNFGQMVKRAFDHAKRHRNHDLPNGRLGTLFEFIGGVTVRNSKDLEAALAVAFLAIHDNRRTEPVAILGGLDSEGRLIAVTDLKTHLTHVFNFGKRKVIIPSGQKNEIPEALQQHIEKQQIIIIEADTLKDVYALVSSESGQD
jgi:hypothetical protein